MSESNTRLAVIDSDKCKPKRCNKECRSVCPISRAGKMCVQVKESGCQITEALCIGCGMCIKKCPFHAISIVNLPRALDSLTSHRFSLNGFKLHGLPYPRPHQVLGLLGENGTGKSTALKILADKIKPNLGILNESQQPDWSVIIKKFRGSELQLYFNKLISGNMKVVLKPQNIEMFKKVVAPNVTVRELLLQKDEIGKLDEIVKILDLEPIMNREVRKLSGGEMQRFVLTLVRLTKSGAYFFDEPSSFLDIKQRIAAANIVRDCLQEGEYVIAIEHDLAILDLMSDFIHILYGVPSVYGIFSAPLKVRQGINNFLDGYLPSANVRFREEPIKFIIKEDEIPLDNDVKRHFKYPEMKYEIGNFSMKVESATFNTGEIIVLLGQNGVGKTTLLRLLMGKIQPSYTSCPIPDMTISYKPQTIDPKKDCTVQQILEHSIGESMAQPTFRQLVFNQLSLDNILDRKLKKLSGGELQRVAIALTLGRNADVYFIDEPSAYLDAEQRIVIAKIIKKYIMFTKKTAFVVEHDFIMASYLSDRVVVFEGKPSISTVAKRPQSLFDGMNQFLKNMSVTIRLDRESKRPRINRYNSNRDREQKAAGKYFIIQ